MMIGLGNLGHLGKLGHASTSGMNHPEVEASGRAFPIWNTKPGDDKLLSLSIHGLTEQIGTPTPANPVPMRSVGDTGLLLSVMQDKESSDYQLLNIKAAMKKAGHDGILRSVNGIYDEVVYDGKEWKLIQRVKEYSVDDLSYPGNYVFTKNEYESNVHYYIQYKTYQNNLVSNLNSPFMSDYSDKPFWPGISSKGVGYYFGQLCFSMLNGETTETEALNITKGRHYQGLLITPIEYSLDLPVITTYDEQTYFASNAAEVKPRMVARCQVSKALDYIREGLIGYYTGRGRSNDDENKNVLPDLSGNGNDLENKNFAYTINSGYGDGYIQYDGVDDFSYSETLNTDINVHIHCVCSNYSTLISNKTIWGSGSSSGIIARLYCNSRSKIEIIPGSSVSWLNGDSYANSSGTPTDKLSIWSANVHPDRFRLNLGTLQDNNSFFGKVRIYDVLMYDRYLDEEEIQHNYKVSCQYNGEDFSFDPIKQNLVASYRAYDKTNEDQDRDILKDLSGNGHDIQLYNFAFSEGSGYGKYATDFTKWGNLIADLVTKNKFVFTKASTGSSYVIVLRNNPVLNSFKIKASGFIGNNDFLNYRYYKDGSLTTYKISTNGIHTLPASDGTDEIGFLSYNIQSEITIEQIPEYQGALVSDGVDDYGLCENFPAFLIEKGFTVCAIRGWISEKGTLISKRNQGSLIDGAFTPEIITVNSQGDILKTCISFGKKNSILNYFNKNISFIYNTSLKYNGFTITRGDLQDTNIISIFSNYRGLIDKGSIALYALEIYDRDLTDEEIAKVKERMIAEYEEKTGNKYEEE